MSDHSKANIERFNAIAHSWDVKPARAQRAQSIAEAVRQAIPLTGDERAMELGSGTGLLTALLAPTLGQVVAVDSSSAMLAVLQEKAAQLGLDNVHVLEGDLSQSIPAGPFDLIFSSMMLHHIEDVPGLLRQLAAALASGGHLALADLEEEDGGFHSDKSGIAHFGFQPSVFTRWLAEAGLVDVQIARPYVMDKEGADGKRRQYPLFLATARKP